MKFTTIMRLYFSPEFLVIELIKTKKSQGAFNEVDYKIVGVKFSDVSVTNTIQ